MPRVRTIRPSRLLGPAALVLLALQACGGVAPKSEASTTPSPTAAGYGAPALDQVSTVDEAVQALDRAELSLSSTLGGPAAHGGTDGSPPPRWAEAPNQPVGPRPVPGAEPVPHAEPQSTPPQSNDVTDRCATACQAFASMQRAAGRLCALAGEDDVRCERAMARVARAAELVRSACPECAQ
jgi:hypothetical protein